MEDVVIIGAGAAGLSCARELLHAGCKVTVLEARRRAGGRAFTAHAPRLAVPVELGAEFVHGAAPELMEPVSRLGLPFYDVTDRHLFSGRARDVDFWARVDGIIRRLGRGRDRSVESALARVRAAPDTKAMFRAFVEGFHAADLRELGVAGLRSAEESDDAQLNGAALFRLERGYGDLFARHFLSDPAVAGAIVYQAVVTRIELKPAHVSVRYSEGMISARNCVLTVPLGVLQAGAIAIEPELHDLRESLRGLRVGHVARIVFQFRSRFWEYGLKEAPAFFHEGAGHFFPTWWTLAPLRAPVLVAWQGGPDAEEVLRRSLSERVDLALATLERITKRRVAELRRELVTYSHHDWTHDPFSRGAYSYVAVDGLKCARRLREPFAARLWLAGEATETDSARGTVHGAIRSGKRVAAEVLRDTLPSRKAG